MFVYLITNTVNGKHYVGKTMQTIGARWSSHRWNAKAGQFSRLYRAIRKYDVRSFVIEELGKTDTPEQLNQLERLWIIALRSSDPTIGYNLTSGGDGVCGHKHSDEARQKMRKAKLGNVPWNKGKTGCFSQETLLSMGKDKRGKASPFRGRKHSAAAKEKNRNSKLGKTLSVETKARISAANKGRSLSDEHKAKLSGTNNPFFGKKHSSDAIRRISEGVRKAKAIRVEVIN